MYGLWIVHIYIYGSVEQAKSSKREVTSSTPGSSCVSLVFTENLINNKSRHKKEQLYYSYCIVRVPRSFYNMYKYIHRAREKFLSSSMNIPLKKS